MGQKIDWGLSARVFLRTKFENLEFNLNLIFQKQPPVSNITPKTALVSSKAPPFDSWLYYCRSGLSVEKLKIIKFFNMFKHVFICFSF